MSGSEPRRRRQRRRQDLSDGPEPDTPFVVGARPPRSAQQRADHLVHDTAPDRGGRWLDRVPPGDPAVHARYASPPCGELRRVRRERRLGHPQGRRREPVSGVRDPWLAILSAPLVGAILRRVVRRAASGEELARRRRRWAVGIGLAVIVAAQGTWLHASWMRGASRDLVAVQAEVASRLRPGAVVSAWFRADTGHDLPCEDRHRVLPSAVRERRRSVSDGGDALLGGRRDTSVGGGAPSCVGRRDPRSRVWTGPTHGRRSACSTFPEPGGRDSVRPR